MSEETTTTEGAGMVPLARLDAKNTTIRDLTARASDLQAQLDEATHQLQGFGALEQRATAAEARASTLETQFSTFKTVTGAGITDPDLVELVQWQHNRLPEEGRPGLGDWLAGIKADPSTAPVALRPHLMSAAQPANGGTNGAATAAAPAARTMPASNAGAVSNVGAGRAPITRERLGSMTLEELRAHYGRG